MSGEDVQGIPSEVIEILRETSIGYLSVTSPKGDLYTYPIAFYFTGQNVYFATPVSSAKLKFMKANPKVSLIVDNRKLTKDACGAMIQGNATIYSIKGMLTSVTSMVPTAAGFSKKYPGMFSFYAKGKEVSDERKIYKYRFIRINPAKIVYWIGYKFGKYVPKKTTGRLGALFADLKRDQKKSGSALEAIAGMLESDDEEITPEEPLIADESWLGRLDEETSKGVLLDEERRIMQTFAKSSLEGAAKVINTQPDSKVSDGERSLLNKWRSSSLKS